MSDPDISRNPRSRSGHVTIERYGADFIAARARAGLLAKELAKVAHPERLTPHEIEALRIQVMRRQAAKARAALAASRDQARRAVRLDAQEVEGSK